MLVILSAGIAPGLALLSYFYLKDQYELEPVLLVFKAFLFGAFLTFPIMFIQHVLDIEQILQGNIFNAFINIALLEEFFKWFILFFVVYQHGDFSEPYDGIVYGASVSLGFATVENILYLIADGVGTAFGRALLPVSSHALFGVIMGYYLGKAKFSLDRKMKQALIYSFTIPLLLHGFYDYILLSKTKWIYYIIPFMLFLWWLGLKKVKQAHALSKKHHEMNTTENNQSAIDTIG
ncbi:MULTISPECIES: glutamic-type intramembrane protease PrsW [Heyndrickxia]|jgi:RsiW-degrading membrane proteinase PrsW (M82 family)|uniref:Protease PrsW n=1 Tax=Heyndrickxia oleronia TaxID=38875 RepID=A0A8E2I5H4_9BACI|nr:glutamic-type intramembrane protease PrsW [Heyndrickxia oleronia]NYV66075.1 intramembrane metalloprotease PrsW [Bacillus sp. Gen3]OJH18701.1 protease PrsW [Bacillus obstructivus]MBU5213673.1 intramembrane metalloprotease PrsW [Heyndrickxia oleronia]MCI1592082.1 glutamic-type intramembrane protease PrsW [Heyndrickxia oleronia]MCI1612264.1 glutamic-type intramembrane protease PrsW [Heyndrickxia oleronia]